MNYPWGQWVTLDDAFYRYTNKGYWEHVNDAAMNKLIAHRAMKAYELRKKDGVVHRVFPFGTDNKVASSFKFNRKALDMGKVEYNRHLLCFSNFTVDLRTGEAIPHNCSHFLTTAIAAEYYPNRPCPEVFQFIYDAYGEEMLALVRACISMLLDPTAPYGKFIHLIGPSGSGKGTLLRLLSEMFGLDHVCSSTSFEDLATPEGRHQQLTGVSIFTLPDVGGYITGLKAFYELVDNGPMSGRALFNSHAYQKRWDVRFFIASVDHLQIENSGDGWDRRCIPLPTKPREGNEDPYLGSKLAQVKGDIISWALAMPREERDRLILTAGSTNERIQNHKQDAAVYGKLIDI